MLTRPVRIAAFDFPFCIPNALLRDEKFASDAGHKHGAFIGWRTFNHWRPETYRDFENEGLERRRPPG